MKKFCGEGRLIVCTIHQPRSQVYELFNQVLILSEGELIYFGGTKTILSWFDTKLRRVLPLGTSIPDFVLDLVNVSFEDEAQKRQILLQQQQRQQASAGGDSQNGTLVPTVGPIDVSKAADIFKASAEFHALEKEIDEMVVKAREKTEKQLFLGYVLLSLFIHPYTFDACTCGR